MTLVVDASLVTSALLDSGADGAWAEGVLASGFLAAPHFMPAQVAGILRRASAAGEISADTASLAHADLLALRVELFPYPPLAARVWELRAMLGVADAWYVALAEMLEASLATLDAALSGVAGPRCEFVIPPQDTGRAGRRPPERHHP